MSNIQLYIIIVRCEQRDSPPRPSAHHVTGRLKKASGEDRIYNEHVKHGGPHLRRILLVLFNAMLK